MSHQAFSWDLVNISDYYRSWGIFQGSTFPQTEPSQKLEVSPARIVSPGGQTASAALPTPGTNTVPEGLTTYGVDIINNNMAYESLHLGNRPLDLTIWHYLFLVNQENN